jgi:hypothetical protein
MFLMPLLAGCGGPTDAGKSSQPAERPTASVSEQTPNPRRESDTSGTAASSNEADPPAKTGIVAHEPATLAEALKVMDLRQMPKPEKAEVKIVSPTRLMYAAPGTLAETAAFCRKQFEDTGWVADNVKVPGLDPAKYVYAGFDKGGFHVTLSVSKSMKEGWIDVHMDSLGNVDPRRLPRPADAKATYDFWHYVSYATASKPQEVIEMCRKELTAKGWKQYAVSSAKFHAKEGRFLAGFVNHAIDLAINAKAESDGKTTVEYRTSIRDKPSPGQSADMPVAATLNEGKKVIDLNSFPRLADADPGRGTSAGVYYEAPGDIAKTVAFYKEKLKAAGWVEEPRQTIGEEGDIVIRRFDKEGFHLNLQVGKGDKPDRVKIQLVNKGNVDVRRFPRLDDAAEGGLDGFDDVMYETETKPEAAAKFYREELVQRGWKEFTSDAKDYPDGSKSLVFNKNAIILNLRLDKDSVRIECQLVGERIRKPGEKE